MPAAGPFNQFDETEELGSEHCHPEEGEEKGPAGHVYHSLSGLFAAMEILF